MQQISEAGTTLPEYQYLQQPIVLFLHIMRIPTYGSGANDK